MLSFLVQPLERYTSHLADSQSPLFVNNQGAKWERRDVAVAVSRYAAEHGIKSVTPQKLRASLGASLSHLRIEPALVAVILRHRDPATALRHYIRRDLDEARQCLEGVKILTDAQLHQKYMREYNRIYTLVGGEK
jgi:integrase